MPNLRGRYSKQRTTHRSPGIPAAKSSWNAVASWYTDHLASGGTYQDSIIFPGAFRLLNPNSHGRYLDIACGEGSFLRTVRSKIHEAELIGIDAAPELITYAKGKSQKDAHTTFAVADAQNFASVAPVGSIDGATCLMAIQNIERIDRVFADAARVLALRGTLVIVMNHPCFRAPQQSGWGWDETRKLQYRRMDRYATTYAQPIVAHPGSAPSMKTISYHRPLSTYVSALIKAGFVIDALEEWTSDKISDSGPRAKAENVARDEFPLFLAIRAKKK